MDIFGGPLSHLPHRASCTNKKMFVKCLAQSWDIVGLDAGDIEDVINWQRLAAQCHSCQEPLSTDVQGASHALGQTIPLTSFRLPLRP